LLTYQKNLNNISVNIWPIWVLLAFPARNFTEYRLILMKSSLLRCCLSVVLGLASLPALAESADVVYEGGKVYTMNAAQPWAQSVAVKEGRIVYVGSDAGAAAFIKPDTQRVQLAGKLMLPGFIDTHAHPVMAAGQSEMFELDLTAEIDDWLVAIRREVEAKPERSSYMGMGYLASKFGAKGPTKEMLDDIEAEKPLVVMDEGFHSMWMNTRAMELAEINKDTKDPIPGKHFYMRDAQGNPTGWALEAMAFMPVLMRLGMVSAESIAAGAEDVFSLFSGFGITTVYDAGMSQYESIAWPALAALDQKGALPFRVFGSHMIQDPSQLPKAIETLRGYQTKYQSERVYPQVMKIHNDGTKEAFTAAQFEDYVGQRGNKGGLLLEGRELQDFVIAVDKAGFDIHIHAIGDRAVAEALDAFEAARSAVPVSKQRYSIAHTELIRDQDLARFGQLDVVAQTTPYWFATDGKTEIAAIGKERADKLYRFRKVIDLGGKVSFGSDFPATGEAFGVYPLANIEMGMTRKYYGEPEMPVTPPIKSVLSIQEMLRGYTLDAAYQLNMENHLGSLEVGKYADMVVLGGDLFESPVYEIHGIGVEMTISGGVVVYRGE
jgi:predicted amidohydrolase YtcJ